MISIKTLGQSILIRIIPPFFKIFRVPLPPLPSVCAVINNKNKILAINLSYKNGYSLPGGGVKYGETLEEALIREVKEETNLDINKMKYLQSEKAVTGSISHVSACFLVEINDIKKLKASSEGEPLWISIEEFLKNCAYPDVKKHLQHLQ